MDTAPSLNPCPWAPAYAGATPIGRPISSAPCRICADCALLTYRKSAARCSCTQPWRRGLRKVRVVCAHDCPDMCSMLAHVEDGRVLRIEGDPDQPFTAGFACAKVNRDADLVHSPRRLATPMRRVGPKGAGKFAPLEWDEALDEITV